jgi:hypothetical protein
VTAIEPIIVTTSAHNLVEIIKAVAKFACEWSTTETAIDGIVIDAQDGTLIMRATNRYAMAHATLACSGTMRHAVIVNAKQLKSAARILASLIPDDSIYPPEATITVGGAEVAVVLGKTTVMVPIDNRKWVPIEETDPIDLAMAGTGLDVTTGTGLDVTIGISHSWMRKLSKIASRGNPLRLTFHGPTTPVLCEIGDWFSAAIMPIQLSDSELSPRATVFRPRIPQDGAATEELAVSMPNDAGIVK